jgi:hypothetical protein
LALLDAIQLKKGGIILFYICNSQTLVKSVVTSNFENFEFRLVLILLTLEILYLFCQTLKLKYIKRQANIWFLTLLREWSLFELVVSCLSV